VSMARRRLLAGMAGTLALGVGRHAAGADRPLRAAVIRVEPYGMVDARGRHSGAYADIFELLGRELGRPVAVVVAPYARALALLQSGGADMLIAMPSPAIAAAAVPEGGVWNMEAIAIGRAGTRLRKLADLHGLTAARIRGTDYGPAFMRDGAIRHYEMSSHVQGLQMLMEKRVDAVVGGRPGIFHAMHKLGIRREQLGTPFALQSREVQLHLSRRLADPQLAAELRRGMAALRADGRIEAVIARYAGRD
jgi:polar amino acid transport system substrate-binding protein